MFISKDVEKWLGEGEAVAWSGPPQPYRLLDEGHKTATFISWFWAAAWGLFLVGGYYALCVSRDIEIKPAVMGICAVIPLVMLWSPVGDKNRVKKLRYVITNKRVLVVAEGGASSDKPCALPLTEIGTVRVEKADEGTCTLRLGASTFKAPARKLVSLAIRGEFKSSDSNEKTYTGLVLYNISDSDGAAVCGLLKSYVLIEDERQQ